MQHGCRWSEVQILSPRPIKLGKNQRHIDFSATPLFFSESSLTGLLPASPRRLQVPGMAVRSSEDSFSWDIPAAYAFGFYGVDIGDGDDENFSLRLHFVDGTTSDIVIPHSGHGRMKRSFSWGW